MLCIRSKFPPKWEMASLAHKWVGSGLIGCLTNRRCPLWPQITTVPSSSVSGTCACPDQFLPTTPLSICTVLPHITVFVPCLAFKGSQAKSLPFSFCSLCPSHTGCFSVLFFYFSHIRIFEQDFPITWSVFLSVREAPWLRTEWLWGSHKKGDLGECSR